MLAFHVAADVELQSTEGAEDGVVGFGCVGRGCRRTPDIIKANRKKRIAAGSGTSVQEVNRLLKQFDDMSTMMKKMGKGGRMPMMPGMGGGLPGGLPCG